VATSSKTYTFSTCEQYMMAHKAHLFNPGADGQPYVQGILEATDPQKQRTLGRAVPNFDEAVWGAYRFVIVRWGNYFKFTQHAALKQVLLDTGDRELVEASPRDRIWGVGFGAAKAEVSRPKWGLNLLGKALMDVRERIRREEDGGGHGAQGKGEWPEEWPERG